MAGSLTDIFAAMQNGVVALGNFKRQLTGSFNNIQTKLSSIQAQLSAISTGIGTYVESIVAAGSAITLTNVVSTNITSISLSSGDWDVESIAYLFPSSSAVNVNFFEADVTQASSTSPGNAGSFAQLAPGSSVVFVLSAPIPRVRQSLSVTTTVYLTAVSNFTGTLKAYGSINARRVL